MDTLRDNWTLYAVLGVDQTASQQEIRRAYVKLIKQCHPDVNDDKMAATEMTKMLNEAYEVLRDPVRRIEYDNLLRLRAAENVQEDNYEEEYEDEHEEVAYPDSSSSGSVGATTSDNRSERAAPVIHYCCESCSRQDETIRVTVFLWVVSVVFMTFKRGWGKILCSRCRIRYSLLFNIEVLCLGWWGFPWGIIFSIEALCRNLIGGIQPPENNAALLGALAYELYTKGHYSRAYNYAALSYRIKADPKTKELLDYLSQFKKPAEKESIGRRIFKVNPAWYNIALLIIVVAAIIEVSQVDTEKWRSSNRAASGDTPARSSGGSADYTSVSIYDTMNAWTDACDATVRDLASYLHDNLPMTGTTRRGNTIIERYVLDRSKLDSVAVGRYVNSIKQEAIGVMHRAAAASSQTREYAKERVNHVSRAYFNAAILQLSIQYFECMDHGRSPSEVVTRIKGLSHSRLLREWLSEKPQAENYSNLLVALPAHRRLLAITSKLETLRSNINARKSSIESMRQDLEYYDSSGDYGAYNLLVPKYNAAIGAGRRMVREHDALVEEHNRLLPEINLDRLQDAFNDCLDRDVLLTEFDEVNLDSQGQSGEILYE